MAPFFTCRIDALWWHPWQQCNNAKRGTHVQAGGKYVPEALNQEDSIARIRRRLQDRGFDQQTIDGILGGNVLRVLAAFD